MVTQTPNMEETFWLSLETPPLKAWDKEADPSQTDGILLAPLTSNASDKQDLEPLFNAESLGEN